MTVVRRYGVGAGSSLLPVPPSYYGDDLPNGDSSPWKNFPVGTEYTRTVATGHYQTWVKVADRNEDQDWHLVQGRVTIKAVKSDFTDGGSTSGTLATGVVIPSHTYVWGALIHTTVAWSGDTSAALEIGDGTDADRFNAASDPSLFATGFVYGGLPQGTNPLTADATITLTVTSTADFTNVAAGGTSYITIIYWS